MGAINIDMMSNYESMDGKTAALYTYLFNLSFPTGNVQELSERIAYNGHKLRVVDDGIVEYDGDDYHYAEWNYIGD